MAYPFARIALSADVSLTNDQHANGPLLVLSSASGLDVTMPEATGSGDVYEFYVGTSVTSSVATINALTTDIIQGALVLASLGTAAGVGIPTSATSDYITMNGGTTGGIKGSYIKLVDAADATWMVTGTVVSTGAEATPFAAT